MVVFSRCRFWHRAFNSFFRLLSGSYATCLTLKPISFCLSSVEAAGPLMSLLATAADYPVAMTASLSMITFGVELGSSCLLSTGYSKTDISGLSISAGLCLARSPKSNNSSFSVFACLISFLFPAVWLTSQP